MIGIFLFLNNGLFSLYLKNNCEIINLTNYRDSANLISFLDEIKIKANFRLNDFNKDIFNNNKFFNEDDNDEKENYFIHREYTNKLFITEEEENLNKQKNDLDEIDKEIRKVKMNADKIDFLQQKTNRDLEKISSGEEEESEDNSEKYSTRKIRNRNTVLKEVSLYKKKRKKKNKKKKIDDKNNKNKNRHNKENENNNNNNNNNNQNNEENNNEEEENKEKELQTGMDNLDYLQKNTNVEQTDKVYECPICFKSSEQNRNTEYSIAKCRHAACNECWSEWLVEKLECPLCKNKVRINTLAKLKFIYK